MENPVFRFPDQVVEEYLRLGLGGTCFSLTETASDILTDLDIPSLAMTGTMAAGPDIHAALYIPGEEGVGWLLDPGYLLPEPLPVNDSVPTETLAAGKRYTIDPVEGDFNVSINGKWKMRLHRTGASRERFLSAWKHSFSAMKDLIITMRQDQDIHYMRNGFYRRTAPDGKNQHRIRRDELEAVMAHFGLPKDIAARAFDLYQETHPWKRPFRNR